MVMRVKDDLKYLSVHLPVRATYSDAIYELYVRMKIAQGKTDVQAGKILSHAKVKQQFNT